MEKAKIRPIYAIFLSVFIVAVGLAVICVAAEIYYSGDGYSRELVADRLLGLSIPVAFLIAAIILGSVFPLYEVGARRSAETAVRLLERKLPVGGDGEAYAAAQRAYARNGLIRNIVWGAALCVALAAAIAMLCCLIGAAGSTVDKVSDVVFGIVGNILPWIVAAFSALVAAAIASGILAARQLEAMKAMIKTGNGRARIVPCAACAAVEKAKAVWDNPITVWAVRGCLLVVSAVFIIAGICNGGAYDVLIKAINICQECIGLG